MSYGFQLIPSRGTMVNAAPAGWTPPYALPGPGETNDIAGNGPEDVNPAALTDAQWVTAAFASFGGGVFVEDYSQGGAYVIAGTGGHASSENIGALIADFDDGTFKRLDPQGGAYQGTPFSTADTGGTPWYELTGSSGVPAPGHGYHMQVPLSAAMGGGTKGSVLYVTRAAIASESVSSTGAHRLDLASGVWSQYSTNQAARTSFEASAVLDVTRSRAWLCTNAQHNFTNLVFLNLSTGAFGTSGNQSGFPSSNVERGFNFMHAGLVIRHGQLGTLYYWDPDDTTTGWQQITLSGSVGTENEANPFVFYPPTGNFYKLPLAGGTSLTRLIPPATNPKTNTWTADTVTVSPSLPAASAASGGSVTNTVRFFYVPSIERLAWLPGGIGSGIHLINPGS